MVGLTDGLLLDEMYPTETPTIAQMAMIPTKNFFFDEV